MCKTGSSINNDLMAFNSVLFVLQRLQCDASWRAPAMEWICCRWVAPRTTVAVTATTALYTAFHRGHAAAYAVQGAPILDAPLFDLSLQDAQPEWLRNSVTAAAATASFAPDESQPFEGGTAVRVTASLQPHAALACTLFRCAQSVISGHVNVRYLVRAEGAAATAAVAIVLRATQIEASARLDGMAQTGTTSSEPASVTIILGPPDAKCTLLRLDAEASSECIWLSPQQQVMVRTLAVPSAQPPHAARTANAGPSLCVFRRLRTHRRRSTAMVECQ
jgi:hypothetical protein